MSWRYSMPIVRCLEYFNKILKMEEAASKIRSFLGSKALVFTTKYPDGRYAVIVHPKTSGYAGNYSHNAPYIDDLISDNWYNVHLPANCVLTLENFYVSKRNSTHTGCITWMKSNFNDFIDNCIYDK